MKLIEHYTKGYNYRIEIFQSNSNLCFFTNNLKGICKLYILIEGNVTKVNPASGYCGKNPYGKCLADFLAKMKQWDGIERGIA